MSDQEQESSDLAVIRPFLDKLSEHFDSVHIFATHHQPSEKDGTVSIQIGRGNWFSRYGQIREWIIKQDELTRIQTRNDEE